MGIFSFLNPFKSKQPSMDLRRVQPIVYAMYKNGQIIRENYGKDKAETPVWNNIAELFTETVSIEKQLQSYSKNVIDYACVFAIANTLASMPVKLYTEDKNGEEVPVDRGHDAWQIIEQPNPVWTWYDFVEAVTTLMELSGFCVIENVYPKQTKELWPLRSDLVEPKITRQGITQFIYRPNNQKIIYNAKDGEAFQTKFFNPLNFNKGLSPYNSMRLQLSVDYWSLKYMSAFFENDAHLGGLLFSPVELQQKKKEEMYAMFSEKHEGAGKAFLPLILGKDWKFERTQVDPKEANVSEHRGMTRGDIITGRGCYPVVLGFLDGASYSNANQQWRLFYRNTMLPKTKKIEGPFNKYVFKNYGVKFKFDTSAIPELREEESEKASTMWRYWLGNALTINEMRAINGKKPLPIPYGDMLPKQFQAELDKELIAVKAQLGGGIGIKNVIEDIKKKRLLLGHSSA